jgi:hypothetical protein
MDSLVTVLCPEGFSQSFPDSAPTKAPIELL